MKCPHIYLSNNILVFVEKSHYVWMVTHSDLEGVADILRHLRSFYVTFNYLKMPPLFQQCLTQTVTL